MDLTHDPNTLFEHYSIPPSIFCLFPYFFPHSSYLFITQQNELFLITCRHLHSSSFALPFFSFVPHFNLYCTSLFAPHTEFDGFLHLGKQSDIQGGTRWARTQPYLHSVQSISIGGVFRPCCSHSLRQISLFIWCLVMGSDCSMLHWQCMIHIAELTLQCILAEIVIFIRIRTNEQNKSPYLRYLQIFSRLWYSPLTPISILFCSVLLCPIGIFLVIFGSGFYAWVQMNFTPPPKKLDTEVEKK